MGENPCRMAAIYTGQRIRKLNQTDIDASGGIRAHDLIVWADKTFCASVRAATVFGSLYLVTIFQLSNSMACVARNAKVFKDEL
jgi:hypothetical protein